MGRRVLTLLTGALAGVAQTAQAHHSWGTIYDGGEPVNVEAVITGDVYRNPHAAVKVDIMNDLGEPEEWTIEWRGNRNRDRTQPVEYDLNAGDEVVIDGRTARDTDRKTIQMTTLVRPADGMTIQARQGRGRRGGRRQR